MQKTIFLSTIKLLKFVASNTILFQIKDFGGKINRTVLAMSLLKINARSRFTRLRIKKFKKD